MTAETNKMKPDIALIYDADCPNAAEARAVLRLALQRAGLEPRWTEYDRAAHGTPEPLLHYGSPTILVDGRDVSGETGLATAALCRVYPAEGGLRGIPPIEAITRAIAPHAIPLAGRQVSNSTASGALGLALASTLAWLCCLPIATGAFGIVLAAIAAAVSPWWPILAAASVVFLIITIVRAVRGTGGSSAQSCEVQNRKRNQWLFVSVISALTILLLTLPWWSAELTYRLIR